MCSTCISDIPEAMAIMKSPPAGPPAMPCSVTLWYYCKDTIPSLSLSAWTAGTFNEMINSKDLSCSGNQGWRQAQLYIGEQNYRISVRVKKKTIVIILRWEIKRIVQFF